LKSSNKGGSTRYTLLFCQVILFSFAVAYGMAWMLKESAAGERKSSLDRRQLFQNYHILNAFLAGAQEPEAAQPGASPLLAAIESLKQAQAAFDEKKYRECVASLGGVPDRFPFLAVRRDALRLKSLHALRKYPELLQYSDAHPSGSMDLRILRLDSLLKCDRRREAASEFKELFARGPLAPFARVLPRPALAAMLKGLNEGEWFAKFSALKKNGEGGEFGRELPYSPFRELNRLFQAEFAYSGRNHARARRLLDAPFSEKYQLHAEALQVKMDLWDDAGAEVGERLRRIARDPGLASGLMFDLGQILVSKGEFARALPFCERYLRSARERGDDYWRTAWLLAWIHYRQNERDKALEYFRLGGGSPNPSYRIASRYWQGKLENDGQMEMARYPFSYYAVKVLADKDRFRDLHLGFLCGLDDPPGERLLEVVEDLKVLARNKLWDEAAEAVRWAKGDPRLSAGDLNLLKVIESLLYYQQNSFFMAFSKFRSNFRNYESVRLPNFLSGIFFPRQFEGLISAYSQEQEVDPGLVLALIREESFFRSDARSPANAYGLMQLLQRTAREIAGGSGLRIKARDLCDPEINIRLGLNYLKTLLDRYDGRLYLALAAYNAGTARVDQWLQDFSGSGEDEFIEMIPFTETRNYVKNILRNYFFYRYYYEKG
jgi:soluble lytic murein transglycosylase